MDDYLNFPVVQQILPPIVTNVQNMNYQLRSKVPAFQFRVLKVHTVLKGISIDFGYKSGNPIKKIIRYN
jgi:hypothetical protein